MTEDIFDRTLAAMQSEKDGRAKSDALWEKTKAKFAAVQAVRADTRGEKIGSMSLKSIIGLAKKYYPMIATGGIAGVLPMILADEGGFSGLKGVFGKLLGVFGLGG